MYFWAEIINKLDGYSEQTGCTFIVVSSCASVCVCVRLCGMLKQVSSLNRHLVVFPQNWKLNFYLTLTTFRIWMVSSVKN